MPAGVLITASVGPKMLGLDRRAAHYTWSVVFILLLLGVVYLIRETLFIFAVALLFAYLLVAMIRPEKF